MYILPAEHAICILYCIVYFYIYINKVNIVCCKGIIHDNNNVLRATEKGVLSPHYCVMLLTPNVF